MRIWAERGFDEGPGGQRGAGLTGRSTGMARGRESWEHRFSWAVFLWWSSLNRDWGTASLWGLLTSYRVWSDCHPPWPATPQTHLQHRTSAASGVALIIDPETLLKTKKRGLITTPGWAAPLENLWTSSLSFSLSFSACSSSPQLSIELTSLSAMYVASRQLA